MGQGLFSLLQVQITSVSVVEVSTVIEVNAQENEAVCLFRL
jgi:hypothetical protein